MVETFRAHVLAIALAALGFPGAVNAADQDAPKSGYEGDFDLEAGYAPDSTLHFGSEDTGKVHTSHARARYTGNFSSGGPVDWSIGLEWEKFIFGLPSGVPLPDSVTAASIPLGVNWKISDHWRFSGEVAPGVYSDFHELNGPDFNAPIQGGLSYAVNNDLVLFLVFSFDARRDPPVLGGPGVRWNINKQWTLSLLLPRPRIEYRPADHWTLYAGAEIAGGTYQLADNNGSRRGNPATDDVNMSYREIRGGLGVQWQLGHGFRVEAAAGWMFDRRFVIHERHLQWNGDGAPYARVQLGFHY